MRLLLVEDEASAMRRLVRLVRDHLGDRASLCCVDDVAAAIEQLEAAAFDGVLLDLNLGGSNGFEVMRAVGRTPCVVVSAYADRSLEAFDHAVLDFVAKPIVPARLARALDRLAAAGAGPRRATIVVRSIGRAEIVYCDDLVRIEAADDYAELVTVDGRHLLHDGSLALLERRLPSNFVRVHRSHIVNVAHASAIVREDAGIAVRMAGGQTVPVSRRRLRAVGHRLLDEQSFPGDRR
ncbi:DNA-binding LytR/AlgR family response regulator [Sphingomonas naasensis]|uniref:Response regulator transcription factor n=1 Tax=Sphingomonas naasensis TaxID=1344951 RepID=A0A4S1WTD1_9SPHN|nr:LytTR family DNA-binding domain-containing protein [Sphingomonas naasensis]NIJ19165.1 DNA-binding LytR/AlgR family response regulator [Sphingomonas naasensis]TGX46353.1 response regulator transcription factor [Sphingomonas naasensis]